MVFLRASLALPHLFPDLSTIRSPWAQRGRKRRRRQVVANYSLKTAQKGEKDMLGVVETIIKEDY